MSRENPDRSPENRVAASQRAIRIANTRIVRQTEAAC